MGGSNAATILTTVSVPWWWTAFIVPFLSALLAIVVAWIAIRFDRIKATNQELIKKRLTVYDAVVPKANDILCFFESLGNWKSLSPEIIVQHKRDMDKQIYIYGPLFSKNLVKSYHDFASACFATFQGKGLAARLRVDNERLKRQWGSSWKDEWDAMFTSPAEASAGADIRARYTSLLDEFAREISGGQRQ
jgi:hypothetical protein